MQCFDLYVFRDSVIMKLNQTETKLPSFVDNNSFQQQHLIKFVIVLKYLEPM